MTKLHVAALVLTVVAACNGASSPASGGGDDQAAVDASTAHPGSGANPDAAIAAAACTGLAAQPLDATWNLTVNSVARQFQVHVPAAYAATARTPIVINLHGLESSGSDQASLTSMIAKSDAEGFIAIHPEGTGSPKGWNGGACCNPAASSGIDDVAFISALIDNVSA
jgi:polyhydroxybutyrate depolymerase